MHHVILSGSHYEMGRNFGKQFDPKYLREPQSERRLEFARECEPHLRRHAPGLLEEIHGVSEGTGLPYEHLLAFYAVSYLVPGCNVYAVSGRHTANGHPMMARNMDWLEEEIQYFTLLDTAPDDGIRSFGFSFGGCAGRSGGFNEAGLAIGSASIPFYQGGTAPGFNMMMVTRFVLDHCSTAREAAEYLERVPHTEPNAFLVADRSGEIARVECCGKGTAVEYDADLGFMSANNMFQDERLKHLDNMDESDRAYRFRDRIRAWFKENQGEITPDLAMQLCSSHEGGICDHTPDSGGIGRHGGTIWSWVVDLDDLTAYVADGYPCKQGYNRFQFEVTSAHVEKSIERAKGHGAR